MVSKESGWKGQASPESEDPIRGRPSILVAKFKWEKNNTMPWSHESQSLKIRFSQGPGMCRQCHQEAAQGSNSCHCFSPGSQHWTFYFIVGGRCLGHKVLPANSLGGRVAFLMKSEVWKLWNKYPKVKACLNKCEISQTQTPPWNSLVLQCLVLFIEDGSLIQGLR